MVRQHVDQTTRTRNFTARNERIETGVLVKSQKRERRQRGKKSGRMFSVESERTVFKRRLLQFKPRVSFWSTGTISSTSQAPTQTDRKNPYKYCNLRTESPSGLKGKRTL